jgi:hypothetical protein
MSTSPWVIGCERASDLAERRKEYRMRTLRENRLLDRLLDDDRECEHCGEYLLEGERADARLPLTAAVERHGAARQKSGKAKVVRSRMIDR